MGSESGVLRNTSSKFPGDHATRRKESDVTRRHCKLFNIWTDHLTDQPSLIWVTSVFHPGSQLCLTATRGELQSKTTAQVQVLEEVYQQGRCSNQSPGKGIATQAVSNVMIALSFSAIFQLLLSVGLILPDRLSSAGTPWQERKP